MNTYGNRQTTWARGVAIGAAAMVIAAGAAIAQAPPKTPKDLKPPTPPVGKTDMPWTPYALAIIVALMIVGVNFIPSKRGHQD